MRLRYPGSLIFLAVVAAASLSVAKTYVADSPTPSIDPATFATQSFGPLGPIVGDPEPLTPGLTSSAECIAFAGNPAINGGYLFIPPDPMCAAGPDHVINTGNCYIEWRLKAALTNAPQVQMSLDAMFAGTPGMIPAAVPTNMFDPKCTYDPTANRFVIVTLQTNAARTDSRILIAVSKTPDPNAGWWRHAINSTLIIGGVVRWADYPGLSCDNDALYVTANMFNSAGTNYAGSRLWIMDKGPTYAGPDGSIVFSVYDAWALSGGTASINPGTTTMPTHMWSPEPGGVGTFLVATGISDLANSGGNEYVAVIRVNTPLAPTWNFQLINVGDIANGAVPNATQLGTARTIATVSLRVMNAVWRDSMLYTCNTLRPALGVNSTQATAHWYRLDTTALGALTVSDQGDVGAEDVAATTHTFMPAVNVDKCDNMAIGFSASGPGIYASAYYATRALGDAPGTIGASVPLAIGMDTYIRTFVCGNTSSSRWGDYSGLSLCPVDQVNFWVYNEYAGTHGTVTGGTCTPTPFPEDGQWFTRIGSFKMCEPVSVAISSFGASAKGDVVTLRGEFQSNLRVQAINVYRGGQDGSLRRIDTIDAKGTSFAYTDKVAPGSAYRYQIGVVDPDGEFMSLIATVKVKSLSLALEQNNPNPFNPETTINFTVPEKGHVVLSVYDANGRLVRSLVDGVTEPGSHNVSWNGRDNNGASVGSGVYFYRLTAGKVSESRKMVLLK